MNAVDPDLDPEQRLKGKPRLFPDEYEGVGGEPAGQVTPEGIKVFLPFLLDDPDPYL